MSTLLAKTNPMTDPRVTTMLEEQARKEDTLYLIILLFLILSAFIR